MTGRARRYHYGAWHGGSDPLEPPVDLRSALDQIGRDVMEGASPRSALEELLRTGTRGTSGLDELTRRLWQRRSELQRRHNLDGTVQEVRRLLDRALDQERRALAAEDGEDARFRELQLSALPPDAGGSVRELAEYDWRSAEAREAFEEIRRMLGGELLEQRFAGMKDALRGTTPEDVERVRAMLDDLSELLAAHARGDSDVPRRFDEFMAEHGEFFPESPRDVDELIDALAARSAAAQRMVNSMSEQQRAELAELSQQAFGDPRIGEALNRMDQQLRSLRPGEDWSGRGRFRGDQPMGLAEATEAMAELGELEQLAEQLGQSYPGASLQDIDLEALERQLGERAVVDAQRLADIDEQLRRQGLLQRAPDGNLRLSPRAMRRLGETALRSVISQLRSRQGERDTDRAGAAGELTGTTRPWAYGDTEPWDTGRTVRNAVLRRAASGPSAPRLDIEDLEVAETEQRSRAAVALCVDTSWSMVQDGRWVPMKRTALALHHLVATRYRSDALQLITFGRHASTVDVGELAALEGTWEQGTNLHHALLLAGRHVRRNPDAQPVVLVVTDGEPTAHLEADGEAVFQYPPTPRTLGVTLSEVDSLRRLGATLSVFMLGEDPRLEAFVDIVARRGGGRVVAPSADGLGAAVVGDYLRTKRQR
ncbi:VWA domain-containing protein [Saccharopolyspora sp. NFXS83]|uniref:vWA domain-containing protein n=1 Tax=Saccharopolyspora sp. NFXS83 TaxID=2993560 RepID=UPI00224B0237|nr:VWA domain-containing protein [Saccharopolyspora sp. NFXS83]MCX2734120.1 VWA domain-containing protein [Saccharopolyspora sp. NFXS83]